VERDRRDTSTAVGRSEEVCPQTRRLATLILMRKVLLCMLLVFAVLPAFAIRKPHVVAFGKWQTVKWYADFGANTDPSKVDPSKVDASKAIDASKADTGQDVKVRPLYVDTKLKEFTTGPPHEITDHLFVVRRAYRVNDSLPAEEAKPLRWRWQLGGWLQVDRVNGRVSALNLPEFDPYYSSVAWYRDYAAYCGVSDDGKKLFAVVTQLARRKPLLKKPLGEAGQGGPDANCPPPGWDRQPVRVTFDPKEKDAATFAVRGHSADLIPDLTSEEPEEETPSK